MHTRNSWSASTPRAAWGPSTGRCGRISSKSRTTRLSATSWNIPSWTIQTYAYWNLKAAEVEQRSTEPLETETGGTAEAMNKREK